LILESDRNLYRK